MLAIVKVPVPVLLRVKLAGELLVPAGWLGKAMLAGERPTRGAVPVPVRLTVCGLFVALSVKVSVADAPLSNRMRADTESSMPAIPWWC